MYKKSTDVISGLNSWRRKCAITQGVLIRADNQAVRAAGRSKAVICFAELQTCTNSVVGVKKTNKKIFFLLLFSAEKIKLWFFKSSRGKITHNCSLYYQTGFTVYSVIKG